MKITKDEVIHVANLARLDLDEASLDQFANKIGHILEYIDTLNQIDTSNIQPTSNALSLTNAFREDKVKEHMNREAALSNAPEKEKGFFVVPKVIG